MAKVFSFGFLLLNFLTHFLPYFLAIEKSLFYLWLVLSSLQQKFNVFVYGILAKCELVRMGWSSGGATLMDANIMQCLILPLLPSMVRPSVQCPLNVQDHFYP